MPFLPAERASAGFLVEKRKEIHGKNRENCLLTRFNVLKYTPYLPRAAGNERGGGSAVGETFGREEMEGRDAEGSEEAAQHGDVRGDHAIEGRGGMLPVL